MGDISTWSPTDELNTMAPPDGWPEGMATNAVNNSARSMMGAVRRWYDTVTEQLASLTSSLASYLPLTGGTLSGPLSATSYYLDGVGFASRDAVTNFHAIYDADGLNGALYLGGAASGYSSLYRAEHHSFQSNDGSSVFATVDTGGISAASITGNVLTGNTIYSNGQIVAGTGVVCTGNLSVSGTTFATGNINCNAQIDCVGNIDAGSYTLNGGPLVLLTEAQLARIEERLARLERATA